MRAAPAGLVILVLGSGCLAESVNPTYLEHQLVSIPGLDGIWREDSRDPRSTSDDMILYAIDSVTYRSSGVESDNESSSMEIRTARTQDVTFLDIQAEPNNETHQFALANISPNRIEILEVHADSVKALVKTDPEAIPHLVLGDRLLLTGTPEQVQTFLISAGRRPGYTESRVWLRVPDDAVCNEMPVDTVTARREGGSELSAFDFELSPRPDSSAEVRPRFWMARVRAGGSLLTVDDTIASPMAGPGVVLSPANPFAVVSDARIDRRLEIRRIGVGNDGFLRAEVVMCHDQFPSSREAIRGVPAPANIAMRIEQGPSYPSVRYVWSPVPGATAYEVLWSQYRATGFRSPGSWNRAIVRDTSYVLSMRNLSEHTWRVRAFAEGIGFGPLSAVQTVPSPWKAR